ncbi:SDR family oxidoreductase [Sciscionella sediminilitoris]|uniref:SDR family oxidoreductase n=1 Tax=Sciscionella sediminilitoris TaxID=1445613 RepID=UPI0004DF8C63|nr:SDR family oxidoreductase [Sciscionella sp. SE31]
MSGRFDGKVALVTGAGRGQGRGHAVRLAAEGADVALVDLGRAGTVEHPPYRTATIEDLRATQTDIRALGRRAELFEVDVRDHGALVSAANETAERLGGIDYVIANAGITDGFHNTWELPPAHWRTMIDINLTGVFHTCHATVPRLIERGAGSALVLVSSVVGIKPVPRLAHYVAAKMALRGLGTALAAELGPYGIRCNTVHPGGTDTEMTAAMAELNQVPRENLLAGFRAGQLLPGDLSAEDSTAAVLWLLSTEARMITGMELAVDAGESKK